MCEDLKFRNDWHKSLACSSLHGSDALTSHGQGWMLCHSSAWLLQCHPVSKAQDMATAAPQTAKKIKVESDVKHNMS